MTGTPTPLPSPFHDRTKLQEASLEPKEEGRFSGKGVDGEGRTYNVEVTIEPTQITWRAKNENRKEGGFVISVSGSESR